MTRIVHVGGGVTATVQERAFEDPTLAHPRNGKGQFALHPGKRKLGRSPVDERWLRPADGPECTWSSDGGCRRKLLRGRHYCAEHEAIVHPWRRRFAEAAE